ncbi:MAG: hypothetical protein IJ576_02060 [Synergistaceae bacterium]|nr:hypothetical protein [Synergistaceae bacterium]
MASFIAAVHVVLPMALLMCLGAAIRAKNIIDRPAAARGCVKIFYGASIAVKLFKLKIFMG